MDTCDHRLPDDPACLLRERLELDRGPLGPSVAVDLDDVVIFVHAVVVPEIILVQHRGVDDLLTLLLLCL